MKKNRGELVTLFLLSFILVFASCDSNQGETSPDTTLSSELEHI